uniref:PDZ domain-containing protein n=1 Tax=Panagrolaimus sp. JU765 TaxID=591449 RepID=A0AC34RGA8_9BILA
MGHEGIFVRNISSGSIAEKDGRLKVGDRIWEIDGQNVSEESTNAIVEKLKSNKGTLVEIVVKRLIE